MLTPISQRNVVAVRPARASVVVRAVAKPDAPKETMASTFAKVASHAVASAVSAALLVSSVAPSAVQAAVPNQTQGIEVAFDFFGSTKGPTTEAARIGPVETAQRAADQLNSATNNVFGDVKQKAGATFSNATNSSGTPTMTKDSLGRDLNPVSPVGPVQEATNRATGSSDINEIRQSIQSASKRVAALPEENPLDAAKNALGRAKDSIKRVANENTATAPGEGPDLQAASDAMMDKFKQKKFEQEGKPQVSRVAQLVAFNTDPVEAVKNVTNQNPLEAAKNVLGGDPAEAIKNVTEQNPLDAAKNALGRAKDSIKRAANENTATAPGEGPDLQAASDEMMEKFKQKKFEQEGKPQVMKVAFNFWGQTPAADNGRTQADTSRTNASPFDAARNIGNNPPAGSKMQSVGDIGQNAGQDLKNQASQAAQGLQNKASSITSGGAQGAINTVQNKVDDAASSAKGFFNNVTNNSVQDKAQDAASTAKGLFNNVTNNSVQDKAQDAASTAKGLFNNVTNNSVQDKAQDAASTAKGLFNKVTNSTQNKADDAASSAKGLFDNVKQAATTPVSQRPNLQDAQDKLVNNATNGAQNNSDSAASGAKGLLNSVSNTVQNKADDAASSAKGLLSNVTNNSVQDKAEDAASTAKGLFNKVTNSAESKADDAASSAKGLFNNVTNNSVQDKAQDAASSAKGLFNSVTNSTQNKADNAASDAKGLFSNVSNSVQNKADDASSTAKGLFDNVKQTAATPVSQRPNLQDAQDSLFPTTGNNSTEGKPEVTKDAFGRDINQMDRTSNPAQAIQREVKDAAGAAGRALNSANVPTPDSGAQNVNLPDVGAALKGLTNKAQDAASNFSANNM